MAAYPTLASVRDVLGGDPQEMTDWLRGKDIIGGLLRANLHLAQYVAQVRFMCCLDPRFEVPSWHVLSYHAVELSNQSFESIRSSVLRLGQVGMTWTSELMLTVSVTTTQSPDPANTFKTSQTI